MNPESKGPFDKDVLEGKATEPPPPLSEKDFIHEPVEPIIRSFPVWLWIFLATILISLIWGMMGWYKGVVSTEKKTEPFLDVTNRDFSVFLWQFPSYIRSNSSKKIGYLTGFFKDKAALNLPDAEKLVSAPPDLVFLYHTWKRLLVPEHTSRAIKPQEFTEFLGQSKEWDPANWPDAPKGYVQFIQSQDYKKTENLQTLPEETLPQIVRMAFQGWINYFKEGAQINEISPTVQEVQHFLEAHPHYKRNYWRNIQEIADQEVAGPDYLHILLHVDLSPTEKLPSQQVPSFLKVALYNAEQAEKEKAQPLTGSSKG